PCRNCPTFEHMCTDPRYSQPAPNIKSIERQSYNLNYDCLRDARFGSSLNQYCASGVSKIVLQHGVIPGSCQTKAQGISSPGSIGASLMWPRNDGELLGEANTFAAR